MRPIIFHLATLAITAVPACAAAEATTPFAALPLSDVALAEVSGTSSPFPSFSRGNMVKMVDAQTRSDFFRAGLIGREQMDVWWGTIGSELIANSVRATAERLQ